MLRVWNPDYRSNSLPSDIWGQEFSVWEWNFPDNDEAVDQEVEQPEVSERPIRKG